ncbi:pentapeptide repeat-containing protein [Pusillimonas sp. (ex Stolz et al. 2005)]|uniref:pentapeptide repeat-containing protein n=1 Tax=Pusillimonas sp. (ex Stolz et al. 2005) TaxID=1979962 RepID=UPI00345403C4
MRQAFLRQAILRQAILRQAILRQAILRQADLRQADLRQALMFPHRFQVADQRFRRRRVYLLEPATRAVKGDGLVKEGGCLEKATAGRGWYGRRCQDLSAPRESSTCRWRALSCAGGQEPVQFCRLRLYDGPDVLPGPGPSQWFQEAGDQSDYEPD